MSATTGIPLVMNVDHVSFLVQDLDAAKEFYIGLLGCTELDRPDLGIPGAWLETPGGVQVHLLTPVEGLDCGTPPAEPNGVANHVAFAVARLTDAVDRLCARGYDVREGHPDLFQVFVQDPSGNVIEFIERIPQRSSTA